MWQGLKSCIIANRDGSLLETIGSMTAGNGVGWPQCAHMSQWWGWYIYVYTCICIYTQIWVDLQLLQYIWAELSAVSTAGYLSHCKQIVELTGGVASKKRRTVMSNI